MLIIHPVMFYTFSTSFYHKPLAFVPNSSAVLIAPSLSYPLEIDVIALLPYYFVTFPTKNALFFSSYTIYYADISSNFFYWFTNYKPATASGAIGGARPLNSSFS